MAGEDRVYMDELWRRLRVFATRSAAIPADERGSFEWLSSAGAFWWDARERAGVARARSRWSVWWLLRQLLTIGLVHAGVLVTVYFLLLLGDALFTSYAIVMRDAVFVSYVAQLGWLQRMASDVKAAIAFVVGVSALVQMLLFLWRATID